MNPFVTLAALAVGTVGALAVASAVGAPAIRRASHHLSEFANQPSPEADFKRVAHILGRGIKTGDPRDAMWASQSAAYGQGLTLADVQAMKRDRRRAVAAYPEVSQDDLFEARWFGFKPMTVPDSYGSGNSEGTQDPKTGKWYLDSAYLGIVRPQYVKRATDAETEAYFAAKRLKDRADKLARLQSDGEFFSMGGTGGSLSVTCKPGENCVVEHADEWASKGKRWTFPFVPEEWLAGAWSLGDIKKMPSFAQAVEKAVDVTPSGMSMSVGSFGSPRGTLMPGETATVSVAAPLSQR